MFELFVGFQFCVFAWWFGFLIFVPSQIVTKWVAYCAENTGKSRLFMIVKEREFWSFGLICLEIRLDFSSSVLNVCLSLTGMCESLT